MTDSAGRIRLFNEAAQKITGYTAGEVRGKDAVALLAPPEYRTAVRDFMQACQSSNPAEMLDYPFLTKSGEQIRGSWQCCAMDDGEGCPELLWHGVALEERVRLEEASYQKGTFVHKVLEGVAFPLFVLDRQYCYLAYNAAHREMMKLLFGADVAPRGHFLSYFREPDKRVTTKEQLDRALAGEAVTFEGVVADERNRTNNILVVNNPVRDADGEVIGVAVAAYDISGLRQAEAEVVRMQSCYKALVEEIPAVMMVVGAAGKIEYINSYGAGLFRFAPAELAGRSLEETILPEVESTGRNLWLMYRQIWSDSFQNRKFTHENLTRNGRRLWIEWSIQPGGSPMTGKAGWLCMGVDVTEKHRSLELERHRLERNRQNEIMQDILSGRLSEHYAADQLLAVGLDLRNPLLCLAIWRTPVTSPEEVASLHQETDLLLDRCRSLSGGIVWETADCIGILASVPPEMASQMRSPENQAAEVLWRKLGSGRFHGMKAAGAAFASPGEARIARLFFKARSALLFGPCLYPDQPLHCWQDLGWLRLLAQNVHSTEAREFVAEHLSGVLTISDEEKRDAYLATLRKAMDGKSVVDIALEMNIHGQTVRYRLAVLKQLLGVDGFEGEIAINTALALRLYAMQNVRDHSIAGNIAQ